eukprot:44435_1
MEEWYDRGGLLSTLAHKGFCLVFETKSSGELQIEGDKIMHGGRDLLEGFKRHNISFNIRKVGDGSVVFVVVSCNEMNAEHWIHMNEINVSINPEEFIKFGRQFEDFMLAHKTYIEGDHHTTFEVEHPLKLKSWKYIRIPYDKWFPSNIYKQTHAGDQLYLKVLFQMLTHGDKIFGVGYPFERLLQDEQHPLSGFLTLHHNDYLSDLSFLAKRASQWNYQKGSHSKCSNSKIICQSRIFINKESITDLSRYDLLNITQVQ